MIQVIDPLTDRIYYVIVCGNSIRLEAVDGSIKENIPNPFSQLEKSISHGAHWLEQRLQNKVVGPNWRPALYEQWQSPH